MKMTESVSVGNILSYFIEIITTMKMTKSVSAGNILSFVGAI